MAEKRRIVGIDLGTTNTLVASVKNRVPKVVPGERGNLIIPSVVALSPRGDLLVGGVAKDQAVTNPKNTVWGAKRLIGRKWDSRAVQEMRSRFPYELVEAREGATGVKLSGRIYALEEISAIILGHAKKIAEQFLGGTVEEAIITVPAYYNDHQRNAVKEAGLLAGFDVKRIVNEPTAAALAYGFNRGLEQKVLVYDLGGGTFDVSVLQVTGNIFEVLATGGDTFLGGTDFDNRVIQYLLESFREQTKVDLSQSPIAMQRLRNAAEAAKIDLTLMSNVSVELPYIEEQKGKPLDLRFPLGREQLNQLTHDLVDRTFEICDDVLTEKGIARSQIDEVILVGGQSRMPLVQQRIQEHFGRPPRKGVHPDECVALGAALLGRLVRADRRGDADRRALDADRLRAAVGALSQDHREEPHHPDDEELPAASAEGAGQPVHRDGDLPGRLGADHRQRVRRHGAGAGGGGGQAGGLQARRGVPAARVGGGRGRAERGEAGDARHAGDAEADAGGRSGAAHGAGGARGGGVGRAVRQPEEALSRLTFRPGPLSETLSTGCPHRAAVLCRT